MQALQVPPSMFEMLWFNNILLKKIPLCRPPYFVEDDERIRLQRSPRRAAFLSPRHTYDLTM